MNNLELLQVNEIREIIHSHIIKTPANRGSKLGLAFEIQANWSSLARDREAELEAALLKKDAEHEKELQKKDQELVRTLICL